MDDEEPDHDNRGPAGAGCVFEVVNIFGENYGNDNVRDAHANSANSEDRFAAHAVDV